MKRHYVQYYDTWKRGPMTFWVHVHLGTGLWQDARDFEPPAPGPVGGKGYPLYFVEVDGFTFRFASLHEMRVLIDTFSVPLLPSNLRLTLQRDANYGLSHHWLNRLPKSVTPWRKRRQSVKYLRLALRDFERLLQGQPNSRK